MNATAHHPPSPGDEDIDSALRAWGEACRASATTAASPARGPRRTVRIVAVAASVVAVVAAAFLALERVQEDSGSVATSAGPRNPPVAAPLSGGADEESNPVTGSGAATSSSASEAPTTRVTFENLTVDVPSSWTLNDTVCGTAVSNTVITPELHPACHAPRPEGVSVVQFVNLVHDDLDITEEVLARSDGRNVPVEGLQGTAVRFDRQTMELPRDVTELVHATDIVLPDLKLMVSFSSPDPDEVERLIRTLTVVG